MKAAKAVFEKDGFLDSRISDIAKRAKVSYGAFYHYFDSKEQLFREVADAQEQRLSAPPDDTTERSGDAPIDRIRDANRRYLERYRAEAKLMGVIEQASRYDAHVNAARMARQRAFAERSQRAIARWQKEGLADQRVDPAIAADALGSMIARFSELWLTQGYRDYDFNQVVEQMTLLWVNAIGLEDAGAGGRTRSGARRSRRPNAT